MTAEWPDLLGARQQLMPEWPSFFTKLVRPQHRMINEMELVLVLLLVMLMVLLLLLLLALVLVLRAGFVMNSSPDLELARLTD